MRFTVARNSLSKAANQTFELANRWKGCAGALLMSSGTRSVTVLCSYGSNGFGATCFWASEEEGGRETPIATMLPLGNTSISKW